MKEPQHSHYSQLPCLLRYQFLTKPQPIQVSQLDAPSKAVIEIVVSNPNEGNKVYCKEIDIYVPTGNHPQDLTPNLPRLVSHTSKWSVGRKKPINEDKIIDQESSWRFTRFVCTCNSPNDYEINYPLTFTLMVDKVSTIAGEFTFKIVEKSSYEAESDFKYRYAELSQQKVLPKSGCMIFISSFLGKLLLIVLTILSIWFIVKIYPFLLKLLTGVFDI
jgi:hypothetical protein